VSGALESEFVTETSAAAWRAFPRSPVTLPRPVEQAFAAFLKQRHPKATPRRIDAAASDLSEAFTEARGSLPGSYLNQPPVRSAYLAHFHPQQVLKGVAALGEVYARASGRGLWPDRAAGPLRVADLGAGLGAMSQALLCGLAKGGAPSVWPEMVLVDHQKSALADARELTTAVAAALGPQVPAPRVRTAVERLDRWIGRAKGAGWRYDVILLGAILNEIQSEWEPLFASLLELLDEGGIVIVVEPALLETSRNLMALREFAKDVGTTLAPCTHDAACPLLATRKDWCFTVRRAQFPAAVVRRAALLGHQTTEVRYALWAFRPGASGEGRTPDPPARVVSERMRDEQLLCVADGTERVRPISGSMRGDLAAPRDA
jgi:hypothetical protein